jgi:O-antigen ligase
MKDLQIDHLASRLVGITGFIVSVLLFPGLTTDPVNLPKAVTVCVLAFMGASIALIKGDLYKKEFRAPVILLSFIAIALLVNVFFSPGIQSVRLWGTSGRNTGALTYLSFVAIAIAASQVRTLKGIERILKYLFAALFIVSLYNLLVITTGNDPLPWENPDNWPLGTFGNSNFNGAFLGIAFSMLAALFASRVSHLKSWLVFIPLFLIGCFQIVKTHALQGLLVLGFGAGVVILVYLHKEVKKIFWLASVLFVTGGVTSLLGILQVGPLSSILYKPTVSIRGEYWASGWSIFQSNPILGVGLDGVGDWYRRGRRDSALTLPGVETVTNSSHNVFLDIAAGGGIVLAVPVFLLILYVVSTSTKKIWVMKNYDPTYTAIYVGFLGYLLQAFVSINQIGVAVWGFIFLGLLIAMNSRDLSVDFSTKVIKQKTEIPASFILSGFIGGLIGVLIASPPFVAATNWKDSLTTGDPNKIVLAIDGFPRDSSRYVSGAQIFYSNNLPSVAADMARKAVVFNQDDFNAWKILYKVPETSVEEKKRAFLNLKRLDPLNPEWK